MPTFFKTESGQLINLDNVDLVKDGRVFFNSDPEGDGLPISIEDEYRLESRFWRNNDESADNAQNFGSLIHCRLEEIAESLCVIAEAVSANKAA